MPMHVLPGRVKAFTVIKSWDSGEFCDAVNMRVKEGWIFGQFQTLLDPSDNSIHFSQTMYQPFEDDEREL